MRHEDLTRNHIIERWVYANAAARTSATGFVTGDIGKIAYQTDTGQYWRLITTTPTWQIIDSGLGTMFTPADPTGTTSTSAVAMGLGSVCAWTPKRGNKMLVTFCGSITNSAASAGAKVQIKYGTGTPPSNGGSGGVPVTPQQTLQGNASTAGLKVPFSITALVNPLGSTEQHWFDIFLAAVSTGTASVTDITFTLTEL